MASRRKLEETALILDQEALKRLLEKDFRPFLRRFWRVINPNTVLTEGWYLDAIAEYLMEVRLGQITRLIINQPPRSAKTSLGTEMFPCWWWCSDPAARFAFYSYSFNLSVASSLRRRRIIESVPYQEMWALSMEEDENTRGRQVNSRTGAMTILTGATGMGGNILIVDDLHNTEQAESDTDRAAGVEKFRTGLMTRLDSPESSPVIVIGQRLHDKDICGELLRDGGWTHLCLPAEARREQRVSLPISGTEVVRAPDNSMRLLDPRRLPDRVLRERKRALGASGYEGQYQQDPAPPGGVIFQSGWFRMYTPGKAPHAEQVAISVDASFGSKEKTASNVAIHAWGMAGLGSYLLGRDTKRRGFAESKQAIRRMATLHGASVLLIEPKANGQAIIEDLSQEWTVIPVPPDWGDKVARAEACSPMAEAGLVYLPDDQDGAEVRALAARFPNAIQDDDVDAMSQFLNWRRKKGTFMEWWKYLAEQAGKDTGRPNANPNEGKTANGIKRELHLQAVEGMGNTPMSRRMQRFLDRKEEPLEKPARTEDLRKAEAPCRCGAARWFHAARGRKCLACGEVAEDPQANPIRNL